jgi:hypothetical protein
VSFNYVLIRILEYSRLHHKYLFLLLHYTSLFFFKFELRSYSIQSLIPKIVMMQMYRRAEAFSAWRVAGPLVISPNSIGAYQFPPNFDPRSSLNFAFLSSCSGAYSILLFFSEPSVETSTTAMERCGSFVIHNRYPLGLVNTYWGIPSCYLVVHE